MSTLSVCVLGSSSAGNATLVRYGRTAFLIDCGFSPAYITTQLALAGLALEDLTGVLITHTHGDHVNEWFVKKALGGRIPFFCPQDIELHLQTTYRTLAEASHLGLLKPIINDCLETEDFLVRSFPVPHDSPGGCFGYNMFFASGGELRKVSVVTDIAFPTTTAAAHCADSDILVMESNHDPDMLESSGRPYWLKKRIRETGHLSNAQCSEALVRIFDRSKKLPANIFLAHVSQECNTNAIAAKCAGETLTRLGVRGVQLHETFAFRASGLAA